MKFFITKRRSLLEPWKWMRPQRWALHDGSPRFNIGPFTLCWNKGEQ